MIMVVASDYYVSAMYVTFYDHVFRMCRLFVKGPSLALPVI